MPNRLAKEQIRQKYQTTLNYLSRIVIGNGLMMLVPLLLLLVYPDERQYFWSFFLPATILILVGIVVKELTQDAKYTNLNYREGGVLVVLIWVLSILLSSLPFLFVERMSFTHAIFESTSGLTTTGLTVVTVSQASRLIVLWRSILQFVGGAGIAIIMISAIIGPQGMGIYQAEGRSDKLIPNIIQSTKLIVQIYIAYVIAGTILYVIAGMTWFDAVNHSFSAVSTGGFSTKDDNIGFYDSPAIELISMILMLLGSINFAAQFVLLKGNFSEFLEIGELRFKALVIALITPFVIYFGTISTFGSVAESTRAGIFAIITAFTTTGFGITSFGGWHQLVLFILIMLMIIGGGYGSTSGGIKMFRVHILLNSIVWQFQRYFLPQNVVREDYVVKAEGKYFVDNDRLIDIANFALIYMLAYFLMNFVFLAFGYSLMESMFESASVLSGVGLSIGITNASTPTFILWAEVFGMILGRLEFLVIFVGLTKMIKDFRFYYLEK